MPIDDRAYVIDTVYQDRASTNEFVKWLGIKAMGGMRPIYKAKRTRSGVYAADLAALVLVSRSISGARYNPWEDIVELNQGRIWYWGDAKADAKKSRDDFIGNRMLAQIWEAIGERRWSQVPPILHFSKRAAGTATFNGVCILHDLQDAWFEDKGRRVRNYRAVLDILPIWKAPLPWLLSRRAGAEVGAPLPWSLYAKAGVSERLKIHAKLVRRPEEQLPAKGAPEWRVLRQLHELKADQFERLVVRAFSESDIAHEIRGTRLYKDGGFDFEGAFKLPPPLAYTVPLKGEVKRYEPGKTSVGPRHVSRLVARLQRGEHGVFVTTSYFTTQAQEEVFADKYPVELISGDRLVGMLQHQGAVVGGKLVPAWVAG